MKCRICNRMLLDDEFDTCLPCEDEIADTLASYDEEEDEWVWADPEQFSDEADPEEAEEGPDNSL